MSAFTWAHARYSEIVNIDEKRSLEQSRDPSYLIWVGVPDLTSGLGKIAVPNM